MKIALRHPSGLEIEFEGDEPAFDRFVKFLAGDVQSFVQGFEPVPNAGVFTEGTGPDSIGDEHGAAEPPLGPEATNPLDPRTLHERMERVGANSDIDRVTVIAQAAVEAGQEGVSSTLADSVYDELGIPKPSRWPKAFSNAKTRGLLRNEKYGLWKPTVNGENYAKHGTKPARRAARRSPGQESQRLELSSGNGEER